MTLTAAKLLNADTDVADLAAVVNGLPTDPDVINRAGRPLRTVARLLAEITANLGYELPAPYAVGLNIERTTQTVENAGTVYAPLPSAIPFVTGAILDATKWYVVQRQFSAGSKAAMAALPALNGSAVALSELGLGGLFVFDASDLHVEVGVDTEGGVYVPPQGDASGHSGAWVRVHDGIVLDGWFGTKGDGVTDDTLALNAASAFVNHFGGTLALDGSKTYLVGTQSFPGEAGHLYSYGPAATGAISITGATRPVTIEGRGAKIIYPDNYKYGSYDPVTGVRYDPPTLPFNNPDYRAMMLDGMVRLENNTAKVVVRNLELDGRATTAVLGGFYNDSGRQIPGSAVFAYGNTDYELENIYAHDHPLDGWIQGWTGLTVADGRKKATATNCDFIRNCRQGLSQVGGNGLTAINCRFNETGRGSFQSAPSAGADLEAEGSIVRNTHFIDCEFADNFAVGLLHGGGDVADILSTRCSFIGTTSFTVWPDAPRMAFDACTFVGSPVNAYTSADPGEACKFRNCRFTAALAESPTGEAYVYGTMLVNLGGGDQNVLLDGCHITTGGNMAAHAVYTNGGAIFRSCTIHQDNVAAGEYGYPRGFWHGVNILDGLFDFNGTHITQNFGHLVYNGTAYDQPLNADSLTAPSGNLDINVQTQVHGALLVQAETFSVGKNDFSGPTNSIYYRTGGAFSLTYYESKRPDDATIADDAVVTTVNSYYDPYGLRLAGRNGVVLGSLAQYDTMIVKDTGPDLHAGLGYYVGGTKVIGSRQAAVPAAATDLASVITLANYFRTAGINHGLWEV